MHAPPNVKGDGQGGKRGWIRTADAIDLHEHPRACGAYPRHRACVAVGASGGGNAHTGARPMGCRLLGDERKTGLADRAREGMVGCGAACAGLNTLQAVG